MKVELFMDIPNDMTENSLKSWYFSATNAPMAELIDGWIRYKITVDIPIKKAVELECEFVVLTISNALLFGLWQNSFCAGGFMFVLGVLLTFCSFKAGRW